MISRTNKMKITGLRTKVFGAKSFCVITVLLMSICPELNATVFICEKSDPVFPEPCERIDRVRINGVWMEADCDNVQVPKGWIIDCCCE